MPEGLPEALNKPPTFGMEDDGEHFWWSHDCLFRGVDGAKPYRAYPQTLPLGGSKGWTLIQVEPLTVSPSILCGGCGTHGFIQQGVWKDVKGS